MYTRGFGANLKTALYSIPTLWPFNLKPCANINQKKLKKKKATSGKRDWAYKNPSCSSSTWTAMGKRK